MSRALFEPCPFCDGTGQRVVAPPRSEAGVRVRITADGRAHGYVSTYSAGCRCDLCRAAKRQYARERRAAGKTSW